MTTVISKKCPLVGSCSGEKCAGVKIDSKSKEFDGEPNESLGFTYCQESCGCAGCGCFLCSAACLFYRTYAKPLSDEVYEIFTCPIWTPSVTLSIQLNKSQELVREKKVVRESERVKLGAVRLGLVNAHVPPLPLLNKHFLSDGKTTVMLEASPTGSKVAGTIGALQCTSRKLAETMHCQLPHETCQCVNGAESVSCTCYDHHLEKVMKIPEFVLPITAPGLTIEEAGQEIQAKIGYLGALEIQIDIHNLRLAVRQDLTECKAEFLSLEGCYNCLAGAELTYKCTTDFGGTLAHVTCQSVQFSVSCEKSPTQKRVILAFTQSVIQESCLVECSSTVTQVELKGQLSFVETPTLVHISNIIGKTEESRA